MKYGLADTDWEGAKAEAKAILKQRAPRKRTIAYSELCAKISTLVLDPHSQLVAHLLDEISREEAAAGRGMLSVLVVHKGGDQRPGPGFYGLAAALGRDVSDEDVCWIRELELVATANA